LSTHVTKIQANMVKISILQSKDMHSMQAKYTIQIHCTSGLYAYLVCVSDWLDTDFSTTPCAEQEVCPSIDTKNVKRFYRLRMYFCQYVWQTRFLWPILCSFYVTTISDALRGISAQIWNAQLCRGLWMNDTQRDTHAIREYDLLYIKSH
jgi:hypothetical protein